MTDTIDNNTSNFDEGLLNHGHIYTMTKDDGSKVTTPKSVSHHHMDSFHYWGRLVVPR
jgi:hypothetical protein